MNGPVPYCERLRAAIRECGNPLCAGIDPDLHQLQGFRKEMLRRDGVESYLKAFGEAIIEAASGVVPAVKLQSAYFEAAGDAGLRAMSHLVTLARRRHLLVILDAKRGDIADTMRAYGRTAFEMMDADALTVTPYMGLDVVAPLVPWLLAGRGIYVVWITSNASGAAIQDVTLPGGQTMAEHLLELFDQGLSAMNCAHAWGVVYGATKSDKLSSRLAQRLQDRPLLIPGVGAQGGRIEGALRSLVLDAGLSLVNVSRGLLPDQTDDAKFFHWGQYSDGVRKNIKDQIAALGV